MILVDANLLIYAINIDSPFHLRDVSDIRAPGSQQDEVLVGRAQAGSCLC